MMIRSSALALASVFIFVSSGWSQEATTDFCSFCKDHVHVEESPYHLDFRGEIPFIVSSGAILGAGLLAGAISNRQPFTLEELAALNIQSINSLDRRSVFNSSSGARTASDYLLLTMTVFPVLLISEHHTRQDLTALLAMSLETMAITFGITNVVKHTVDRARPNVYNPAASLNERTNSTSRESFFSGHTSHTAAAAFVIAKVISDYHPNMTKAAKIGLWGVSASIPAVTAYFRVKSGKHFPTDVMAGYAVGAFTGWLIPHLHKVKKQGVFSKVNMQVYPAYEGMQFSFRIGL